MEFLNVLAVLLDHIQESLRLSLKLVDAVFEYNHLLAVGHQFFISECLILYDLHGLRSTVNKFAQHAIPVMLLLGEQFLDLLELLLKLGDSLALRGHALAIIGEQVFLIGKCVFEGGRALDLLLVAGPQQVLQVVHLLEQGLVPLVVGVDQVQVVAGLLV
jgi:hypothetical protein